MTLAEIIEVAKSVPEKREIYQRVMLGFLHTILLFSTAEFSGWTVGVGLLALLHDDVVQFASAREQRAIYGLIVFSSAFGLVQAFVWRGSELSLDAALGTGGTYSFCCGLTDTEVVLRSISQPSTCVLEVGGLASDMKTLESNFGCLPPLVNGVISNNAGTSV